MEEGANMADNAKSKTNTDRVIPEWTPPERLTIQWVGEMNNAL